MQILKNLTGVTVVSYENNPFQSVIFSVDILDIEMRFKTLAQFVQ